MRARRTTVALTKNARNRWMRTFAPGLWVCLAVVAFDAAGGVCVFAGSPPPSNLSIDRGLQQPLATARSLIERGQFAEAIRALQPVLSDPQNTLVFLDGRYIDAKIAANRLIGSLPSEARTAYERDFGVLARHELERALATGRVNQILAVAAAYRHTEAGCQALAAAVGLFFDSGQFIEAAAAARELLETPEAVQASAAVARLVTARIRLGQAAAAQQWIEYRRDLLSHHDIEIQGRKHRLDEWLLECIQSHKAGARPGGARVNGGHSQMVDLGSFERPSVRTLWSKRFEGSRVAASLAQELIVRRVESGIPPVFHPVPLIVDQTLIVRRNDELAAYDLRDGKLLWCDDVSPPGSSSLESETLADRAFCGGPQCALSTDGERVFTVVEDSLTFVNPGFMRRGRRMLVDVPAKNSLAAYDLHSGKRLWQLTEIQPLVPPPATEQADHDVDFLGPPLSCGGTLYVLGRTNEGANLLALNPADGTVRWGKSLAGFSGFETDSTSIFGPACVPIERDGLLICPTPEGILIAFDLATRTCRWAYRAQPTEEPMRLPARWGRRFPVGEARWLTGWRENLVRMDEERCLFVSPRSTAIHALAIDTGKLIWTQPVAKGLFLGPIFGDRLLAISQYRALAFDAANGSLLWSSAIGLPSGRGFLSGERYLLPQSEGGLAAIDVHRGVVDFPVSRQGIVLGNLVPVSNAARGAAVSQSNDQLALLASLDRLRIQAAESLRRNSADIDARRNAGQLDGEAGYLDNAERLYGELLAADAPNKSSGTPVSRLQIARKVSPPEQEPIEPALIEKSQPNLLDREDQNQEPHSNADRRALFDVLIADLERNPKRCFRRLPQLLRTAAGDDERAIALRTAGATMAGQGERMVALDAFLELARLELPAQIESDRGPRRVVAFDRQLEADLQDLLSNCSPLERQQASARIQRVLELAIVEGDVSLFGRIFQRLRRVGLDRAFRRKIEAAMRPDSAFSHIQLDLWDATTRNDPRRAAEAWRDLAELSLSHGNRRQAALCYRRLVADYRETKFDDGLRPADLVNAAKADRPLSREIEDAVIDPWPAALPDAIPESDSGSSTQFCHLPMEIMPGSLCERLDVALDVQGETLRFQGNGQPTYWDLRLPAESSQFRRYLPLHHAWSLGPFVIVQVGVELFGVAPMDEGGEPVPTLLWHADLLGLPSAGSDLDVRFIPGALAPGGERILVTDRLGRPVARVGPVRPGFVCYQDRGSLIALDPLTGRRLWRRTDVPTADMTSGDDSRILLLDRRSKRLQALRALDGKTLAEETVATASNFRWLEGMDAVTQIPQSNRLQFARISLLNGEAIWTRSFPAETQFVRMDGHRFLAAESEGTFHVVDADRGSIVATNRISQVKHCVQVHVTNDESRFYVAFSGTLAEARNFRANGQRDDSRNPSVSGALCAIDRRSGQMLWCRPFLDGAFGLDQSRAAPILVFAYRQLRRPATDDDENGMGWPILHCMDKRTGRDVFKDRFGSVQPVARAFAETELGRHEVIVRWPDSSIRFRYAR